MAQDVLEDADVHIPVAVHQGGGGVAQLVDRIPRSAQANFLQVFLHHHLHGDGLDAGAAVAEEEGIPVHNTVLGAHCQIAGNGFLASLV